MKGKSEDIKKKYYSISEVAEKFQVNPSLIRFWESEFEILQPAKNKKGERRFVEKDIDHLKIIYHLVKEKGYTLDGAKEQIRNGYQETHDKLQMIDSLQKLKNLLQALREII